MKHIEIYKDKNISEHNGIFRCTALGLVAASLPALKAKITYNINQRSSCIFPEEF